MSILWNSEKNCQIRGHPGGVRWWKNGLRGLFKQVMLGQVRKAKKSWKSEALGPPIHSVTCFGQIFERTVFERTTYPDRLLHCFIGITEAKLKPKPKKLKTISIWPSNSVQPYLQIESGYGLKTDKDYQELAQFKPKPHKCQISHPPCHYVSFLITPHFIYTC